MGGSSSSWRSKADYHAYIIHIEGESARIYFVKVNVRMENNILKMIAGEWAGKKVDAYRRIKTHRRDGEVYRYRRRRSAKKHGDITSGIDGAECQFLSWISSRENFLPCPRAS